MEEQRVTSGELAESAGGTAASKPISESEKASDALSVVGRLHSTLSAAKAAGRVIGDQSGTGKAAGEDGHEERENQMSKGEEEEQFHE